MLIVLAEGYRAGDLAGVLVDGDGEPEFGERAHHPLVEVRDGLGAKREPPMSAIADRHIERMFDEIECDLERAGSVRDGRGGQAARGQVQRHMPAVIQPGRLLEADLPDHLRPQMHSGARVGPCAVGKLGPRRG